LTPHDGEFARLIGSAPGADRIGAARKAAEQTGCVVLLKGPTTVVADPAGRSTVMADGDERLATAGSGDVLAGLIGAFLARGAGPFDAAGAAAEVHALAADATGPSGLVASDLVAALPRVRSALGV
jgi:NAD(P)H-hydrate repair Nnr-like enzyme with NAD(P)H-hydrate dehydratase domain